MKLLEVIGKQDNLKRNESKLTVLETTFITLGKVIGSDPGKDWLTLIPGDIFSKEALVSLNQTQIDKDALYNVFALDHNSWIDSVTQLALIKVQESLGVVDWTAGLIANVTPAGYQQILTPLAAQERKIYEIPYVDVKNKYASNVVSLKDWSKSKPYGSNVTSVTSAEFELNNGGSYWSSGSWYGAGGGVSIRWENTSSGDKKRMIASGLENLSIGESRLFIYELDPSPVFFKAEWRVTRVSLGAVSLDDGNTRSISHVISGANGDKVNGSAFYNAFLNISSPHFENTDPNLPWFKSRVLL